MITYEDKGMKRLFVILFVLLLLVSGCKQETTEPTLYIYNGMHEKVDPVGTVPDGFRDIVKKNLFGNIAALSDRVMEMQYVADAGFAVRIYDFYGGLLAEHSVIPDSDAHSVGCLTGTSDGGFLYVIGFSDHVRQDGTWASESGVSSTIVKCNSSGEVEWQRKLDNYTGSMLHICIETEDSFYFFGDQETPETKTEGIGSPTDIHILKLSEDGTIARTKIIGGSDFDSVNAVEATEYGFCLNCHAQSSDGDFSSAGYWKIRLGTDLNILSAETEEQYVPQKELLGYLDGQPIYELPAAFRDFNDGSVQAFLDYGEFWLVVSTNITGIYEHTPPVISSIWYCYETVYGAYDKEGNVIWKATVDSSPDYDAMAEAFYQIFSK